MQKFNREKARAARIIAGLSLAAGATFGVAACTVEEPADPVLTEPAPQQEAPAGDSAEAEPEAPATPDVFKFGQTAAWDGVEVTLSEPQPFQPSEYAAGAEQFKDSLVVEVRLTNTGAAQYDPSMVFLNASSGEQAASEIFDDNVGGAPSTPVLSGKSVTWKVALNVADPSDLVVEVLPGLEYQEGHEEDYNTYSAVFTR